MTTPPIQFSIIKSTRREINYWSKETAKWGVELSSWQCACLTTVMQKEYFITRALVTLLLAAAGASSADLLASFKNTCTCWLAGQFSGKVVWRGVLRQMTCIKVAQTVAPQMSTGLNSDWVSHTWSLTYYEKNCQMSLFTCQLSLFTL